tara:strand:- start:706 stop:1833 length:1128 start_codon:yes stop_codon:yes gene_type:complete
MADLKLNGVTPNKDQIKLGSLGVLEIRYRNQKVWPSSSDPSDPYDPVEGQDFRLIALKTVSPYFGLFDETLTEVSTPYTFAPLPSNNVSAVATVSDNYTYMLAAGKGNNQTVQLSTDNGQSWSSLGFSSTRFSTNMSRSGQVMLVETGAGGIQVSNDFGANFNFFNLDNIITLGTSVVVIVKSALSSGGKFITISLIANGVPAGDSQFRILKSSDYGASFSDITDSLGFGSTNTDVSIQDALISGDGKYEIYFNAIGGKASRYSDDYGQTFVDKSYPSQDWNEQGQMNESGQYFMLNSTVSPGRYSTDFGVSNALGSVANSSSVSIGVSNSGEFSITGSAASDFGMKYSNDFFSSFTDVSPVSSVGPPFILIDVS